MVLLIQILAAVLLLLGSGLIFRALVEIDRDDAPRPVFRGLEPQEGPEHPERRLPRAA